MTAPFKDYAVEDDRILSSETTLGLGDHFVMGLAVVAALALGIGFYSWVLL
ncbi:hypothetical protein [Brucella pseudogrignonensis]|uniref:Uncharacterized protein n=1 Tax=Brucella pseudogrignonensis TaxID=419475 RepID=A0A256G0C2_9HYPH|nr:hypothetical protein [Brucella pseudogrignonensis]OYR20478.1 hypothetical protein CEV34_5613 [Brucella pseudogrignonensis]